MRSEHINILRALIAAQVAVTEHADEDVNASGAKDSLLKCLAEATRLAKRLGN